METDRSAAKRRASFARADRLAKEAWQKAQQTRVDERRKAEREKADRQRKEEAVKAAERRNALARKRAEQRRLDRHRENLRKEFARKADERRLQSVQAERQRHAEVSRTSGKTPAVARDETRRAAEAYVAQQERRQLRDQQEEHRRQTHRLRVEHQAERAGVGNREAAGVLQHARQIRNIDIAERRALEALGIRERSLAGRAVRLVRGARHFERQGQAIVERHENDRWTAHRDHEARKDGQFWAEQAARLRRISERHGIAHRHQSERRDLAQSHERDRARLIEVRAQAMTRANDNERALQRETVRPADAFERAAGPSRELKR